MAITILGTPQIFQPAFNPIYFYLDSTNKTEEGFRYMVNVGFSSIDIFANLKLAPSPVDGYGIADVHQILKNKVSGGLQVNNNAISANTAIFQEYGIIYGEEYVNYWEYADVEFTFAPSPFESFTSLVSLMSSASQIYTAGDSIFVEQNSGFTNSSYSGVHTVLSANATTIIIDVPFGTGTTGTEGGRVSYSDKRKTQFYPLGTYKDLITFNGAQYHQEFINWSSSTYDMIVNPDALFLTNMPDGYRVKPDNKMWLNFYSSSIEGDTDISFQLLTEYGSYQLTGVTNEVLTTYGCGPQNITTVENDYIVDFGSLPIFRNYCYQIDSIIEGATGTTIELAGSGTSPWYNNFTDELITFVGQNGEAFEAFITATPSPSVIVVNYAFSAITSSTGSISQRTDWYTIQLFSGGTASSELRTINVDWNETRYGNIELTFIDRLGSYIPANFELQSFRQMDIQRDEYQKILGGFNGTGWGYNSTDRGRVNINTTVKNQLTLNSNWLTEEEVNYLKELYSSADVYITENGQLWPVIVKSNSYRIVTKKNKKNIKIEIVIEYANNDSINNIN